MSSYIQEKENILNRLRRIEGQTRGIQRMVEQDKYCVDVLTQLSSVIAACEKVGLIILEDHIKGCLRDAIVRGNGEDSVQELVDVVGRFIRSS